MAFPSRLVFVLVSSVTCCISSTYNNAWHIVDADKHSLNSCTCLLLVIVMFVDLQS